jgi:hypothetical protein
LQRAAGIYALPSQIENYRAKAKKFARLAAVAKSPRQSRQCRKLAEMYWALAMGVEPERAPFKIERQREHHISTYPVEFHRRLAQKWESRIEQILLPMIARRLRPPKSR